MLRSLCSYFRFRREHPEFYRFFKNVLGFCPRNVNLYQIAFTHRSKSVSTAQGRINNERLEYLGDAVLGVMVAEFLYKKYPYQGEGFLTEMRSKMVSRASLNKLAQKIGLPDLVQYTSGGSQSGFKSINGDAFEALVGAIYLEKGYRFTRRVVIDKIMSEYLDVDTIAHTDWNFKSKLIDWGQRSQHKISFDVEHVITQNKENRRQYDVRVKIDGEPAEHAIDNSIKAAEQLASEKTYKSLQEKGLV